VGGRVFRHLLCVALLGAAIVLSAALSLAAFASLLLLHARPVPAIAPAASE
jgi:hypothetical protein